MRTSPVLVIFVSTLLSLAACEKDDICVDGDTPLLRIDFFDVDNPTTLKNVPSLKVEGLLNGNEPQGVINNISLSSIGLPLRIGDSETSFILSRNLTPNDTTTINIDTLTFRYEVKEVFVSRSCGFVANYDKLESALAPDTDNWIKNIEIVETLVANSLSVHVKIFH